MVIHSLNRWRILLTCWNFKYLGHSTPKERLSSRQHDSKIQTCEFWSHGLNCFHSKSQMQINFLGEILGENLICIFHSTCDISPRRICRLRRANHRTVSLSGLRQSPFSRRLRYTHGDAKSSSAFIGSSCFKPW